MIITGDIYKSRREQLINRIPEGSAVFLFAGKGRPMSQDTDYRFLPDRNFFYLTGLSYEEGKLVLVKEKDGSAVTLLFALKKDDYIERWHGKRMSYDEVSKISAVPVGSIHDISEFDEVVYPYVTGYKILTDDTSIAEESKNFKAAHEVYGDAGHILTGMRMVKSDQEAKAISSAAVVTEDALDVMKQLIKPGVTELVLYTRLEYEMARRGSLIPAFSTIVSIGNNSFYLHHSEPEDASGTEAKKGDTIQIDVGARCEGYCADISRVYFVGDSDDEEYNSRRAKLLELIKDLRKSAFGFIKPGETFASLNSEMRKIAGDRLVSWGLLEEGYTDDDVKNYYWHNTAHHLGLDVHDISDREAPFAKGNCLAVEPGVYIREWGLGFRIEDDVQVTDDGCRLLSSGDDSEESICL